MKKSGMFVIELAKRARYYLASERSERDTYRGNTIENRGCLFIWRASVASETLSGVTQSRFRYIYLFIYLFMGYVRPLFSPALLIT